jgi:hypothetical protein
VLSQLKKFHPLSENPYELYTNSTDIFHQELDGFEENQSFSIYEVVVSNDLSAAAVRDVLPFNNKTLSTQLKDIVRKRIQISTTSKKEIPPNTSFLLVYYYYPSHKGHPSVVSAYDL